MDADAGSHVSIRRSVTEEPHWRGRCRLGFEVVELGEARSFEILLKIATNEQFAWHRSCSLHKR